MPTCQNPLLSNTSVSTMSADSKFSNESSDPSESLNWEQSDSSDSEVRVIKGVIITITVSSNVIGALAALFSTNHFVEL